MFTLGMLGAALLLLAGGVFFLRNGRRFSHRHAAFVRTGLLADARVVDIARRVEDLTPTADSGTVYYYPVVEFTAPDGRPVTARTMYGVASRPPARKGQTVRVRFDPADPSRVALTTPMGGGGAIGVIQMILGAFLAAFGVFLLLLWALLKFALNVPG